MGVWLVRRLAVAVKQADGLVNAALSQRCDHRHNRLRRPRNRFRFLRGAAGTESVDFQGFMARKKIGVAYLACYRIRYALRLSFLYPVAPVTNQQKQFMLMFHVSAADERIQTFDTVNQPLLPQEIQCPINCRGLRAGIENLEILEEVVCFHRLMTAPDQFKNPAPYRRESHTTFGAALFCAGKRPVYAIVMIMARHRRRPPMQSIIWHIALVSCRGPGIGELRRRTQRPVRARFTGGGTHPTNPTLIAVCQFAPTDATEAPQACRPSCPRGRDLRPVSLTSLPTKSNS